MAEANIIVNKEYLLGLHKVKSLSLIEELSLRDLNLNETKLDCNALNELTSLLDLDLSDNNLELIPDDLKLPKLKFLNVSQNQLKNLNWLKNFPALVELDIGDNFSLGVDERYKAIFLLDNLERIDGKGFDIKPSFKPQFGVELKTKVLKLFTEEKISKKLAKCETDQARKTEKEKFKELAKRKVRCGPNSLKAFRFWRVDNVVEEIFANPDLTSVTDENNNKEVVNATPDKTVKRSRSGSGSPQSIGPTPKKSRTFQLMKIHNNKYRYMPSRFLQCHSNTNSRSDFSQQIWCCCFEPDPANPSKTTNNVATCGGMMVCISDCVTNKVKLRFEQKNEEFYSLAWTTVEIVTGVPDNILACAGCLGYVHLIHMKQSCAYGRFIAHNKPVQTITFVPKHPTQLLTAGLDRRIILWDIGIPSIPDYNFTQKKLSVFSVNENPLRLLVPSTGYILCGTEGGLYCWDTNGKLPLKGNKIRIFNESTKLKFLFTNENSVTDGLTMVDDTHIATKCAQVGVIFIWSWSSAQEALKHNKSDSMKVQSIAELNWSNTKQFYININACLNKSVLFSGDEDGHLWIYDIKTVLDEVEQRAKEAKQSKEAALHHVYQPASIVPWPKCVRNNEPHELLDEGTLCNDICSNWDMSYIVVASDSNLVCIYKNVSRKQP